MESDNDDKYGIGKKTQKLAELNLALSAHSINGWFGNFERVKRFYKLYLEEKDGTQKLDFALSFFIFSYHLRDWIQIYEQIDKLEYDKKWSKFVNDYPDIKISRDICNVSKHLKISQESRDKNFHLFWEYDSFVTKSNDWTIIYDDKRERLKELMRRVLNAWGEFIVEYLKIVKE